MRITGGRLCGRRLKAPPGATTRPTSARVREAIFNILGPPARSTRVLDAFAGSGTLGLEAISRGAGIAYFVDNSRTALRCLRENIAALATEEHCHVFRGDASSLVRQWSTAWATRDYITGPSSGPEAASPDQIVDRPAAPLRMKSTSHCTPGPLAAARAIDRTIRTLFDWIFVDPPYQTGLAQQILHVFANGALLAPAAVLVVEHDRRNRPDPNHGCLVRTDLRRYGDTEVSFYRTAPGAEPLS
ncbi:MAG: RsmD family RNA methyltransferase [Proteobacteria bacterium]|nr:RsmD family RNA methyltransferase [Pseudomonadota bacterium]